MIVYVDVTAGLNLVMNSLILGMTVRTSGVRCPLWRIGVGAFLGAILAITGLLPEFSFLRSLPGKFAVSLMVVIATFGCKPVHIIVPLLATFYLFSFMVGGAVFGWLCLTAGDENLNFSRGYPSNWLPFVAASIFTILLAFAAWRQFQGHWYHKTQSYQATIAWAGRAVTVTALLDSGNGLHSYWERTPVMIVEYLALRPLLGQQVNAFLSNNKPDGWLIALQDCLDSEWLQRVCIIPYRTIGSENLLLAFRPDTLIVHDKLKDHCTQNVIIGIYGGTFSAIHSYTALLHPALIPGAKGEEA
jgi:stage II sporulation protein GA (sporulation sigma-E factor processing peptidase)